MKTIFDSAKDSGMFWVFGGVAPTCVLELDHPTLDSGGIKMLQLTSQPTLLVRSFAPQHLQ